jgi:N-acetylmuramoyl-L-alanine amidase
MRNIEYIVLHCTACPQTATVKSIQSFWRNNLGWRNPGYHYLIEANGNTHNLLPISLVSNGVAGYNHNSIHISYIGGVDRQNKPLDNRTPQQIAEMIRLIKELKVLFPKAKIKGHRDFPKVAKACPSFDTAAWLKSVGIS